MSDSPELAAGSVARYVSTVPPESPEGERIVPPPLAEQHVLLDRDQVLSVPTADLKLSVRSRKCLQTMGVKTLGDLCRTTEAELLANKEFGETSLLELKEILASKGLRLAQLASGRTAAKSSEAGSLSADEQTLLAKPVSDLKLSVRVRKLLLRLGFNTLAELVHHTGDDLLECGQFGAMSLNEVRETLCDFG